ncbi:4-(cytidine 5'-diphospho)-2-C-methyl-D-erythritol kinase [Phaeovulum sp. W22_SRMD_FR3]|uniref:4-(cytidine 5'-diphospho)-2-C-methyl-D-erythritol kinase n=1 Tax=Phaeovulum sp. W22_SRMD_FR3 TaxID=3240274 RepID=UPI003F966B81
MIERLAPAKVNLTLHVTGRRADGYHLLDSLVVFTELGDRLHFAAGPGLSLSVEGPMASGVPESEENLVLKAARLLGGGNAAIRLEKHLPHAAGLGGGSSDAAAALSGLAALWQRSLPLTSMVMKLGADVPVCLKPGVKRMQGVGEVITPLPSLPPLWLVLVNPGVMVPTPAVFAALTEKDGAPMPDTLPTFGDVADLVGFLQHCRNDLEAPALTVAPVVGRVLAALAAQPGCAVARMSGSGATCFGLFARRDAAKEAARVLWAAEPGWWVKETGLLAR